MSTTNKEAIKRYYTETQFEYGLLWNWTLKTTPALHFGYYDEKATNHQQAINRANEVLAERAGIQHGDRVLDAGCGLGHSSIWIAQHCGAKVTGITLVQKQVKTIEKYVKKHGIFNVHFQVADYLHTPFPDNSYDVVWAVESLCHASSKADFYKEAFRVLKPGGRLIIAENLRPARPMNAEKEALLKEIFNAWAIPDLDTEEEHRRHAMAAGFKTFSCADVTKNMLISYRNLEEVCNRYFWLSKVLHKTRLISSVRHRNMLGSLKQYQAIEQNVFTYNHLLAVK